MADESLLAFTHVTVVRDPNAVVMTSDEAALDRAHWWNQGAAMERRQIAREAVNGADAGASNPNNEEAGT